MIQDSLTQPFAILLLQIIAIITIARIFGFFLRKIGQPSVIGEVIAGIVLGPSLLGMWLPEYAEFLFPKTSLPNLQLLSQIGLVLFMFIVGMELDLKLLKTKIRHAVVISHASIIIPYALGMGLAYFLYSKFAPENISFIAFGLFMGITMSITAFPVLARIIQERGMRNTELGTLAVTCAAIDDVTAWCILAAVIAFVQSGLFISSIPTIVFAAIYVIVMLRIVKPLLNRYLVIHQKEEGLNLNTFTLVIAILLTSSYITEVIGIHALFGAFLAGTIMPQIFNFRKIFTEKIEHVSLGLLLPLFFAFSGLRTQIGLLDNLQMWGIFLIVLFVAVIGKFGGSMFAARLVGQNWEDSLRIGALMNTRGLMELIVLNIGYDLGIITPIVFTMLVLMALVTTFMTVPILDLIDHLFKNGPKGHTVS